MRLVSDTAASPPMPRSEIFAPTPIRRGPSGLNGAGLAGAGLAGRGSGVATGKLNKAPALGPAVRLVALSWAELTSCWARHDDGTRLTRAQDNSTAGIRTGSFLKVTLRRDSAAPLSSGVVHCLPPQVPVRGLWCINRRDKPMPADTRCKAVWPLDAAVLPIPFWRNGDENLGKFPSVTRPLVRVLRRMLN
jgi:hypothetical protein